MKTRFDLKGTDSMMSVMSYENGEVLFIMQELDELMGVLPKPKNPVRLICTMDQLEEIVKGVRHDNRRTKKGNRKVSEKKHSKNRVIAKQKDRSRTTSKNRRSAKKRSK